MHPTGSGASGRTPGSAAQGRRVAATRRVIRGPSMALRFGTDGVRGVANAELTPELALVLGRAAARVLGGDHVVIGRDPRRSGPMLEAALAAGFASAGGDVELVGVVPTPAVAYLSDVQRCVGAVISASHNPFADNGIKLFAPGGRKLPDDVEEAIEAEIERELGGEVGNRPRGTGVGTIRTQADAARAYADHLVGLFETPGALTGLDIALDCANGATSALGSGGLRPPGGARRRAGGRTGWLQHQRPLRRHASRAAGPCRRGRRVRARAWPSTATATG